MLIHKIDPEKRYIDITSYSSAYDLRGSMDEIGFKPYNGMIEEYNELPSWSVIQIETINSKLIKAMYGRD